MTTLLSIKKAIGEVLEQNGYDVYASEVQEGFQTPACFVELADLSTTVQSDWIMQVQATFDILYVPSVKTHEHVIIVSDELSRIFANLSLIVGDRNFNIDQTVGQIEDGNIRLSLQFSYTDQPINPIQEPEPIAENVQFDVNGTKIITEQEA
jgi:hypothetical protein